MCVYVFRPPPLSMAVQLLNYNVLKQHSQNNSFSHPPYLNHDDLKPAEMCLKNAKALQASKQASSVIKYIYLCMQLNEKAKVSNTVWQRDVLLYCGLQIRQSYSSFTLLVRQLQIRTAFSFWNWVNVNLCKMISQLISVIGAKIAISVYYQHQE